MGARRILFLRHARGPAGGLALLLLCCTVYLPGFFSIPPVDRDEARFAQASRQMFESLALPESDRDPALHAGGLAVPMLGDKPRLNKPPLIYWLQAASAAALTGGDPARDAIWMYRVPSLLAALVTVLATWRIGLAMFDPRAAWLSAALIAVSPVFVWEAHQARADMVMVAFTTLAIAQLHRAWRARRTEPQPARDSFLPAVLLWLFVALGVMTKGPITPMVVVLTALTLSIFSRDPRWLRALHPVLGLIITAAVVAPWLYAVARHVGFEHYWSVVYDEVIVRAGSAKEGHWGPPGYHLILLVVLFWPGSLLTALAVRRAWGRGTRRRAQTQVGQGTRRSSRRFAATLSALRLTRRPEAFLLAWLLPSWLVFELAFTKLPHYTMPLYPAVALISARALVAWPVFDPARRRAAAAGAWIWLAVGVALFTLVALSLTLSIESPRAWLGVFPLAAAMLLGLQVIRTLLQRDLPAAQHASIPLVVCLLMAFLVGGAPALFGLSRQAFERASLLAEGAPVTWVGFSEDSTRWFARGTPTSTPPDELDTWFEANPRGVAIVSVKEEHAYLSRPEALHALEYVFGVHYTKGRPEKLAIVKRIAE